MDVTKIKKLHHLSDEEKEEKIPESPGKINYLAWFLGVLTFLIGGSTILFFLYLPPRLTFQAYYQKGENAYKKGKLKEAYQYLSKALLLEPNYAKARWLRFKITYKPQYLIIFDKFYMVRHNTLVKNNAVLQRLLNLPSHKMDSVKDTTFDDLKMFRKLHPEDPRALFYDGYIWAQDIQDNRALKLMKDALNKNIQDNKLKSRIHNMLGLIYLIKYCFKNEKSFSEHSLKHLNQAILCNEKNATAYHHRALIYFYIKNKKKALENLHKSISLYPHFKIALYHRALIFMGQKKWENALKDFITIIEIFDKSQKYFDIQKMPERKFHYQLLQSRCKAEIDTKKKLWERALTHFEKLYQSKHYGNLRFIRIYREVAMKAPLQARLRFLITVLEAGDVNIQMEALESLGALGKKAKKVIPRIIEFALKDDDAWVRKRAFGALNKIKIFSPTVIKTSLKGLADKNYDVFLQAQRVFLNKIDIAPYQKELKIYSKRSVYIFRKLGIAEIFIYHNIELKQALKLLKEVIGDESKYVRNLAIKHLVKLLKHSNQDIADHSREILEKLALDKDDEIRSYAKKILKR